MALNKLEGASTGLGIASAFFPMFAPLLMGASAATGVAGAKKRVEDTIAAEKAKQAAAMPAQEPVTAPPAKFAKGGRIDGCALRGKTKGRIL